MMSRQARSSAGHASHELSLSADSVNRHWRRPNPVRCRQAGSVNSVPHVPTSEPNGKRSSRNMSCS